MKINNKFSGVENNNGIYLPTLIKYLITSKNTKVCLMRIFFPDDIRGTLVGNTFNIGDVDYA
tara:strand:+ start:177 stop:362 length:186 start_codon:yes stop_codon:yes gene_type:complete